MAQDIFLKINGIDGESQDSSHKNEIEVLAWDWSIEQQSTMHAGSGGGAGKATVSDLAFEHYIDRASPNLMKYCLTGKHINEAVLVVRKAGDKSLDYLVIELEDIMITSISTGGSGGEDRLTENVSLNFAKFKIKYQEQDDKGAAKGGSVDFGFNIAENASA